MGPLLVQISRQRIFHSLIWRVMFVDYKEPISRGEKLLFRRTNAVCHLQGASRLRFSFTTGGALNSSSRYYLFHPNRRGRRHEKKNQSGAMLVQKTGRRTLIFAAIAVLKQSVESTSIIYTQKKGENGAATVDDDSEKGNVARPVFSFAFLSFSALYLLGIIFFMCYTCCSVFDFLTAREKLHLNFKIFPRRRRWRLPHAFTIFNSSSAVAMISKPRCTVWKFMRPARVLESIAKVSGPVDGWARRCVPKRKTKNQEANKYKRAWCYAGLYFSLSQKVTRIYSLQGICPRRRQRKATSRRSL